MAQLSRYSPFSRHTSENSTVSNNFSILEFQKRIEEFFFVIIQPCSLIRYFYRKNQNHQFNWWFALPYKSLSLVAAL